MIDSGHDADPLVDNVGEPTPEKAKKRFNDLVSELIENKPDIRHDPDFLTLFEYCRYQTPDGQILKAERSYEEVYEYGEDGDEDGEDETASSTWSISYLSFTDMTISESGDPYETTTRTSVTIPDTEGNERVRQDIVVTDQLSAIRQRYTGSAEPIVYIN